MTLSSTDEPQIESGEDRNPGEVTLLQIRFEKNPNQKLKYLEGEPKILGVREPISLYSLNADILFVCFAYKLDVKMVTIHYI